jgi:hypothetical protein
MMAKMRIPKMKVPKRIAGFKVPKRIRRSELLRGLLASKTGREIAGRALVAGASAAAAVLVAERSEVADATKRARRKGARKLGLLGDAAESAVHAAVGVVTDAARAILPEKRKDKSPKQRASSTEAGMH